MSMTMKRNLVQALAMMAVALAFCLWSGCGQKKPQQDENNVTTSDIERYRSAAEKGDAEAQSALADLYYNGKGVPPDYAEAFKWSRRAAEQGNTDGIFLLATIYFQGRGVPRDEAESLKWYKIAAERGVADAQRIYGAYCGFGTKGVSLDYVEAYKWKLLAAAKGSDVKGCEDDIAAYATYMTPAQIAEGKKRAAAFVPKEASP